MKFLYMVVYLVWMCSFSPTNVQFLEPKVSNSRALLPLRYEITVEPEIDETPPTFLGNITIELIATKTTRKIILSSSELDINRDSITMKSSDGTIIPISAVAIQEYQEICQILMESDLQQNETYQLTMAYSGKLRNDNRGFYFAKYQDEDGDERKFATTMFTKESARFAFPCFDEPALKARFTIKIIRPGNYTSISNEKKINTEDLGNNRYLDTFKETCSMSTYLIAFTISDFEHTNKNGIHRIFARPQAIKEGKAEYALDKSAELLQAVEEFFGMKYQFSKLDHVAVPDEYFLTEAVENWGLITYNERTLLYSNDTFTTRDKQNILTSILHELIHQWFGNLVTPENWNYLWLSEGFATYLQFRIGDLIMPKWRLMEQFHSIIQDRAFEGESSFFRSSLNEETQPSWVAYLKAATTIKMIEHFMTPKIFKEGIRIYLEDHKFGVVKPLDLYTSLDRAMSKQGNLDLLGNNTVFDIMKAWDSNEGYPILNVTRNYQTGEITIEQGVFLSPYTDEDDEDPIWYIPVNYVFNAESQDDFVSTTADFWLTEKNTIIDKNVTIDGWLIVNKQDTGYYRVNYDLINWNRIASFLNSEDFDKIHLMNRVQLIGDSFELAKYGNLDYKIPLELSKYLIREQHYAPFSSFFNAIEYFNRCLSNSDVYFKFKGYVILLLDGVHRHLGYNERVEEAYLDTLNRINILKWLCTLGHSGCRQTALNNLRNWKNNESALLSPNLQEALLCGAISIGNQEDWNFLFEKYESARDSVERIRILKALSCTENKDVLTGFLEKVRDMNSTLKDVDRTEAITSIIESGNVGLKTANDYIRQHFRELWKLGTMGTILNAIGSRLTTEQQLDEFKKFKSQYAGVHMAFRPGIGLAYINLKWINEFLPQITAWFNEQNTINVVN